MQLEALKIFCDVVRTASFSRGAEANGISQSSASHVVHELEKRLGVKLIDRSKRPLVLTAPGRVYFEGCRELVGRYTELEGRVRAFNAEQDVAGTVRVAAIYSVGLLDMSRYTEQFGRRHPQAEVRLDYQHPSRVVDAVRAGDADLGLISFPRKWADLVVIPWRDEPMVLAVHPEHPLAGRAAIDVADLDGLRLVGFDPSLAIRRAIDRFLKAHGVAVETAPAFDNVEYIKRAVEVPGGAAVLPAATLARELAAGTIRALPFRDAGLSRPLAVIHRRAGDLGLAASRFLRLLTGDDARPAEAPPAAAADGARKPADGPLKRVPVGDAS
jgi:DNA-binding transcriptional LysR family regulator